jgi:hypothetical protein
MMSMRFALAWLQNRGEFDRTGYTKRNKKNIIGCH